MYILLTSMDYTEEILPDSAFFYTAGYILEIPAAYECLP